MTAVSSALDFSAVSSNEVGRLQVDQPPIGVRSVADAESADSVTARLLGRYIDDCSLC